jgi:hypothetical protein
MRLVGPAGAAGVITWISVVESPQRVTVRLDTGAEATFLWGEDGWRPETGPTKVGVPAPPLGKVAPGDGWRPQRSAMFAPTDFCDRSAFSLDDALDAILGRSAHRFEAATDEECPILLPLPSSVEVGPKRCARE